MRRGMLHCFWNSSRMRSTSACTRLSSPAMMHAKTPGRVFASTSLRCFAASNKNAPPKMARSTQKAHRPAHGRSPNAARRCSRHQVPRPQRCRVRSPSRAHWQAKTPLSRTWPGICPKPQTCLPCSFRAGTAPLPRAFAHFRPSTPRPPQRGSACPERLSAACAQAAVSPALRSCHRRGRRYPCRSRLRYLQSRGLSSLPAPSARFRSARGPRPTCRGQRPARRAPLYHALPLRCGPTWPTRPGAGSSGNRPRPRCASSTPRPCRRSRGSGCPRPPPP
mmetsp:Transcript_24165/g.44945  ORF Transcript_24165/g.44945 Transcript_24165/m.44945 type:complete len:278 (+) Transcript_24165:512-1345(+)